MYVIEETFFFFFFIKIMFGHYVRPQLGFGQTWVNFFRPMSDDLLLFATLLLVLFRSKYLKAYRVEVGIFSKNMASTPWQINHYL